jgi:glycosyltransferase involved in cell wall biosynthesis
MKNKIGFDANPVAQANLTGIGAYTKRLIESLASEGKNDIELIGYYFDFLGRKKVPNLPVADNITYKRVVFYPGKLVNLLRRLGIDLPVELFLKTKCDYLLFSNYLSSPSIFKTKIIPVVHDLTHVYFPEFMSPQNQKDIFNHLPKTLERSAALITVSETTKNNVKEVYAYEKPVLVTPIPYQKESAELIEKNKLLSKYACKEDFILFVGTLEPRKNIINLLNAYEQSAELNSKYSLVLCGGTDWKFEEIIKKIDELKEKGLSVIKTGYVSKAERDSFYSYCTVFVQPSHYEGFGMPIIEALSYNKPIAVSDIPIFHEVAEDSAVYFDQNSPSSIADGIKGALTNKHPIKVPSYSNLSWNQIAKDTINFISTLK